MEKNSVFIAHLYLKLEVMGVKDVDIIKKIINLNAMNVKDKKVIMIIQLLIYMLMLLILFNALVILIQIINLSMDVLLHITIKIMGNMNVLNVLLIILLFQLKMKKFVKQVLMLI